ncbi:hypothetical protein ACTFIU_008762 [Dictyostelium citrinum]
MSKKNIGIYNFIDKKKNKKKLISRWEDHEKGAVLKELLIKYTRNHIQECEKLQKDIGTDNALSNIVAGMNNLKSLKENKSETEKKTSQACEALVKLVNYGGILMHKYSISSKLIINTKKEVYENK